MSADQRVVRMLKSINQLITALVSAYESDTKSQIGKISKRPTRTSNQNHRWTSEQDGKLVALRSEKVPYKQIARRLGRSAISCSTRIHELKNKGIIS